MRKIKRSGTNLLGGRDRKTFHHRVQGRKAPKEKGYRYPSVEDVPRVFVGRPNSLTGGALSLSPVQSTSKIIFMLLSIYSSL
jgi:hypothetical protein